MRDRGWIVPEWPIEYGGAGLDVERARMLREEMARLNCRPPLYDLGIWLLGPALLEFGSDEQKRQHLPRIARGETRWCQGYSEPGAGSDLASLQCRAEDRGDHFLVNGSKIWTTNADKATWIFCLVRTDPCARTKQEGISFLLIDMSTPGISVRPIPLINGESEFCQTFFDDVRVPKENLVGGLNRGWTVAKGLLKYERKLMSDVGVGSEAPAFGPVQAALQYVGLDQHGRLQHARLRDQLTEYEMTAHALRLTQLRIHQGRAQQTADPSLPLIMKYAGTEAEQRKYELLLAILGMRALGWEDDRFSPDELRVLRGWATSKTLTIAGGTSEVQLNIIAKRVLSLPDGNPVAAAGGSP
jgi:alkylation response protein AidB-like acyl-CoA dehydrogenase